MIFTHASKNSTTNTFLWCVLCRFYLEWRLKNQSSWSSLIENQRPEKFKKRFSFPQSKLLQCHSISWDLVDNLNNIWKKIINNRWHPWKVLPWPLQSAIWLPGVISIWRCHHSSIRIPMLMIRRSQDRLIFNMEIPIPCLGLVYVWD